MATTNVSLTDDELVILDGHVRPKVQSEVDAAKARIASVASLPNVDPRLAAFVADVVRDARVEGRLRYSALWSPYSCDLCGAKPEPIRFKSGYRKGQVKDRGHHRCIDLAVRFVSIKGHVSLGGCETCVRKALPLLSKALADVPVQLSPALAEALGIPARWVRYDRVKCSKCNWEGHEGQMIWARTLMNDGWYPSECPECSAQNGFGLAAVKRTDGFVVTDTPYTTTWDRRKAKALEGSK